MARLEAALHTLPIWQLASPTWNAMECHGMLCKAMALHAKPWNEDCDEAGV